MKKKARIVMSAGMLSGALLLTGCTVGGTSMKQTPQPTQSAPVDEQQQTQPEPETEEMQDQTAEMAVSVEGKALEAAALREGRGLLLPLGETARALGYAVGEKTEENGEKERRSMELTRETDKITVLWSVSDNTAREISWQKNGLLIPVDAYLTTKGETVYVPAAFFEKAADVTVTETDDSVHIERKAPTETPPTETQEENGAG